MYFHFKNIRTLNRVTGTREQRVLGAVPVPVDGLKLRGPDSSESKWERDSSRHKGRPGEPALTIEMPRDDVLLLLPPDRVISTF